MKKKTGDVVNLENDVVGKYVQKLLGLKTELQSNQEQGITMEFLEKYGI